LTAQRAYVSARWDDAAWRAAFALACSRPVVRALFGDPAYRGDASVPAGRHVHARMGLLLRRVLARHSFMIGLALTGRLPAEDLPPHLTASGHRVLRDRLGRLESVTADVGAVVASAQRGRFDRFSLSDVGSFLSEAQLAALLAVVADASVPGARVVLRQFLVRHAWPASLEPRLVREPELEARLARDDRSFAYDFVVAEAAHA
jgi:S-adenosylmethionine:diacylglycerol 3-amino-3-carboxypropyl transferase